MKGFYTSETTKDPSTSFSLKEKHRPSHLQTREILQKS